MLGFDSTEALKVQPEDWVNTLANLYLPAFADEVGFCTPRVITFSAHSRSLLEEYLSWFAMVQFAPCKTEKQEIYKMMERVFSLPEFAVPPAFQKRVINIALTRLYPILRIVAYLNIHYADKITEETILLEGGISRRGMYRYFQRVTGLLIGEIGMVTLGDKDRIAAAREAYDGLNETAKSFLTKEKKLLRAEFILKGLQTWMIPAIVVADAGVVFAILWFIPSLHNKIFKKKETEKVDG